MNKFLKDLENELKKMKIKTDEIKEILADHKEMIEQALADGLTDEEITLKFGEPRNLAKELKSGGDTQNVDTDEYAKQMGSGDTKGYELHKTLVVSDEIDDVKVSVVSADIKYYPHEGENIEVYFKDVKHPEDYSIGLESKHFFLKRTSSRKFISFGKKSASIIVKVPKGLAYKEFQLSTVSGDGEISGIQASDVKIKSTSGDFELKGFKTENFIISTVSGDVELEDFTAAEAHFTAVSGDFEVAVGQISGEIKLNTVSGDFDFENVEGDYLDLNTVSGDFEGNEVYLNRVDLKSISGDIEINNSDKDRVIEVGRKKTLSGDIKIN